jgi:hypothetical protein
MSPVGLSCVQQIRHARAKVMSWTGVSRERIAQRRFVALSRQVPDPAAGLPPRNRRTPSPIRAECSKILPTGIPSGSRCRPTAFSAADAMQPQLAQSGEPPN